MFRCGTNKFKKFKSKHSEGSGDQASKAATVNLISSTEEHGDSLSTNKKTGSGGTAAKSDHGDKKYGLFETVRRKFVGFGRKNA